METLVQPTSPELGKNDEESKEFVIASARFLLAFGSLIAIYIDPTEPSRYAALAYALLTGYVLFAAVALLVSWRYCSSESIYLIFAIDCAWPTLISIFTEGPNTPFYLFFLFLLLTVSYRWGLKYTMMAGFAFVVLLSTQAAVLRMGFGKSLIEADYDPNRLIMRSIYLLIMGLLIGFLAEEERSLRRKMNFSLKLIAEATVETSVNGCIASVLTSFVDLFSAKSAVCLYQREGIQKASVSAVDQAVRSMKTFEMDADQAAALISDIAPHEFWIKNDRGTAQIGNFAWTPWQRLIWQEADSFPTAVAGQRFDSLLSTFFEFSTEVRGRIYILDPEDRGRARKLDLLAYVVRQVIPTIKNVYLIERLKRRAGQIERAKLARELHDSTLQSLNGIRMQLEAMRRSTRFSAFNEKEILRIEQLLRDQALELRAFVLGRELIRVDSENLEQRIGDLARKLGSEARIKTTFVSVGKKPRLSASNCRELLLATHEAMSNVIRHSGATNVAVIMEADDWVCRLSVIDDGQGFQFSGRYGMADLERRRIGPVVLRERVKSIGGALEVESKPGEGSKVEIVIKQEQPSYV